MKIAVKLLKKEKQYYESVIYMGVGQVFTQYAVDEAKQKIIEIDGEINILTGFPFKIKNEILRVSNFTFTSDRDKGYINGLQVGLKYFNAEEITEEKITDIKARYSVPEPNVNDDIA